ncbi:MAG: hypothetical protein AB1556_02880 [Bacillota bacterium]
MQVIIPDGITDFKAVRKPRVWRAAYAPGKYGMKVTQGEIYSTSFQTGAPGDTSYIKLNTGWFPLEVVYNGETILDIFGQGEDGVLHVGNATQKKWGSYVASGGVYGTLGLHLVGFTGQTIAPVWIYGYPLRLEGSNNQLYFDSRIASSLRPDLDGSNYIGDNTYRWNTVRAIFIQSGDLCFEEKICPICEQPFKDGDVIVLLVKAIHEEHGTMTIPIHDYCKGIPKTIEVLVPEVEDCYHLMENGEVITYKKARFEEVEKEVTRLKDSYKLDEKTGDFIQEFIRTPVAREGYMARKIKGQVKYFHEVTGEEANLEKICDLITIPMNRKARKEEAIERVKVKRAAARYTKR